MDLWIKLTSNHPRVIIIAVRWKTINYVNIKLIIPRVLWDFRPANCSPSWVRFRSSLIFSMWTRKKHEEKTFKTARITVNYSNTINEFCWAENTFSFLRRHLTKKKQEKYHFCRYFRIWDHCFISRVSRRFPKKITKFSLRFLKLLQKVKTTLNELSGWIGWNIVTK